MTGRAHCQRQVALIFFLPQDIFGPTDPTEMVHGTQRVQTE